jgi:hypothetical protein
LADGPTKAEKSQKLPARSGVLKREMNWGDFRGKKPEALKRYVPGTLYEQRRLPVQ